MKNIRLYANCSGCDKILVDMSNQLWKNFVIIDLSTHRNGGIKKQFIDASHYALVICSTFLFCF